jgi:hypothetical protein
MRRLPGFDAQFVDSRATLLLRDLAALVSGR